MMNEKQDRIDALKKVRLLLRAGTAPDCADLIDQPFPFEFIFGLGSDGFTPFEYEFVGKSPGEILTMVVDRLTIPTTFGHLSCDLPALPEDTDVYHLKVEIAHVVAATAAEIVKALAKKGRCGAGCCSEMA